MENATIARGSNKPIRNRVGERIRLRKPYQGFSVGVIAESIGRNWAGVPMYGVHLDGYTNPHRPDEPITVDCCASEFAGEEGEAHGERMKSAIAWAKEITS